MRRIVAYNELKIVRLGVKKPAVRYRRMPDPVGHQE